MKGTKKHYTRVFTAFLLILTMIVSSGVTAVPAMAAEPDRADSGFSGTLKQGIDEKSIAEYEAPARIKTAGTYSAGAGETARDFSDKVKMTGDVYINSKKYEGGDVKTETGSLFSYKFEWKIDDSSDNEEAAGAAGTVLYKRRR